MGEKKLYQKPITIKFPGLVLNGNSFGKKPKTNNSTKNFKTYVKYYLNTSTIHGIKYIGETGRYLIEKLLWSCVIVTLCSVCLFLITKTYVKWKMSPVIVSLETKETPIYEIPFPAVTICPEVKIDPEYFNITNYAIKRKRGVNVTKREEKLFQAIGFLCKQIIFDIISELKENTSFIDSEFIDEVLQNAAYPELYNLTNSMFLGKGIDLIPTVTAEGLCLSFNMLPLEDIIYYANNIIDGKPNADIKVKKWSLEDGYPPGDSLDNYPRRTFLSGFNGGLEVKWLYINRSQIDYLCEEGVHGFKVALHHPCELPNMDKHFRLPLNQAVLVAIKPIMIRVSKDLINYNPQDRRCYFAKEKPLELYKIYTKQNCLVECLTNFTLKQCKCVPFWLKFKDDVKICGSGKRTCVRESKVKYLRGNSKSDRCDCLPACTSLSYEIETSYTNWNWRELSELYKTVNMSFLDTDPQMTHFSKLVVYYKDLQFLTSKRRQLYDIIDFFSNVGGLLALFIGFSLISAVEVIYIGTLRIVCNIKKYGRDYWSGEPDTAYEYFD